MISARFALLLLLSAVAAVGQPASNQAPERPKRRVFEFLPKSLQRDPQQDLTVFTEVTETGRTWPAVSRASPAYYAIHSGGYRAVGALSGGKPFPAEQVDQLLRHSLAGSGYLPADAEHPPTHFLVYVWGPHGFLDAEVAENDEVAATRNILDRAALVGGEKFAQELNHALQARANAWAATAMPLGSSEEQPGMDLGAAAGLARMNAVMDPVKLYMQRSTKTERLVLQAAEDCYYVVVSAYDYESVALNQRVLLWRTRMTVQSRGVSQLQALPVVIGAAAPFFGREMAEPEVLVKRTLPAGKVEVGEAVVVEGEAKPQPAPSSK